MARIELQTSINAPIERCFLLSLSVDLHTLSTSKTHEKAISGITSGIMKLNDTVTWRAKHFGIYQNLTTIISTYEYPYLFTDDMVRGAFKSMHHKHIFTRKGYTTVMKDVFIFEAPLGIIGRLFTAVILKKYMTKFLQIRNETIKQVAEGDDWKRMLIV